MPSNSTRGTGIYVHIPFCQVKCGYCDFISYAGKESLIEDYVFALETEIGGSHFPGLRISSIYFGGGTPNLFETSQIARVLDRLYANFEIAADAEVTIEVNPELLTAMKTKSLVELGFNRISVGLQSLDDKILAYLERRSSARQGKESVVLARDCGFNNVNIDLMYGIQNQTMKSWEKTVTQALKLEPDHVSAYCLTVPPAGRIKATDEATQVAMAEVADVMLEADQLQRYEISNYAKEGRRCRHNIIYWRNQDYLGFGAGAHSHVGERRFWNHGSLLHFIGAIIAEGSARAGEESTTRQDEMADTVIMGFRLMEGIDIVAFNDRFDADFHSLFAPVLKKTMDSGMVRIDDRFAKLSSIGRLFADEIAAEFL